MDASLLNRVARELQAAQARFVPPSEAFDRWRPFPTAGPGVAMHLATAPGNFISFLQRSGIPRDLHFVDLGSGLGLACFAAAAYFEHVTGIEIDPAVAAEAEKVRAQFDVVYFFMPFFKNFEQLMGEKLKEARPGTYILYHQFPLRALTNRHFFRPIPIAHNPYSFHLFQRV
jgi:SAM-dependent methyltransferase